MALVSRLLDTKHPVFDFVASIFFYFIKFFLLCDFLKFFFFFLIFFLFLFHTDVMIQIFPAIERWTKVALRFCLIFQAVEIWKYDDDIYDDGINSRVTMRVIVVYFDP